MQLFEFHAGDEPGTIATARVMFVRDRDEQDRGGAIIGHRDLPQAPSPVRGIFGHVDLRAAVQVQREPPRRAREPFGQRGAAGDAAAETVSGFPHSVPR